MKGRVPYLARNVAYLHKMSSVFHQCDEAASPRKSGILQLASIQLRCAFYFVYLVQLFSLWSFIATFWT
jgi:hypothetical protein